MKYDTLKITRLFIAGMIFLAILSIQGVDDRQCHQMFMTVLVMSVLAIFLKNVWLTLFLWWTMLSYILFRFDGTTYFFNIFFGCLLYFLTKVSYQKRHIDHFIKIIIIFACCNAAYLILQFFDLDFYYYLNINTPLGEHRTLDSFVYLSGFMGMQAAMGMIMALTVPLVATRRPRWSIWASLLLFIPIYLSNSTTAIAAGLIGLVFVLFFKLKRIHWWSLIVICGLLGSLYAVKVDMPGGGFRGFEGRIKLWKQVMRDATKHPIIGHGLDSFRKHTERSPEKYCEVIERTEKGWHITVWDNPHNLLISLIFEFGVLAWIFLGGYLRDYFKAFVRAEKSKNAIATTGFLLVFFVLSMAQFPMWLAPLAVIIIPVFAMSEKEIGLYDG